MNPESKIDKRALVLVFGLVLIFIFFNGFSKPLPAEQPLSVFEKLPQDQIIFIPKINIWVPIIYVESTDELAIQHGLIGGVVHYAGTGRPGEVGNAYIVGHSSNYQWVNSNYNEVFARLPQLQVGDNISVIDQSGQMNFQVISTYTVNPDNLNPLSQETGGRKLLTLQTSYPVGTAKQRFIVVAEFSKK